MGAPDGEVDDIGRAVPRRAPGQSGFSLTESLVSILLVSIVILGIAAGILTTVKATQTVARVQRSEAALSDATESIKAAPWVACAVASTYGPLAQGTISSVEHLQPSSGGERFGPACDPATDTAQRVTVVVGGRSADIVKRNQAVTP